MFLYFVRRCAEDENNAHFVAVPLKVALLKVVLLSFVWPQWLAGLWRCRIREERRLWPTYDRKKMNKNHSILSLVSDSSFLVQNVEGLSWSRCFSMYMWRHQNGKSIFWLFVIISKSYRTGANAHKDGAGQEGESRSINYWVAFFNACIVSYDGSTSAKQQGDTQINSINPNPICRTSEQ